MTTSEISVMNSKKSEQGIALVAALLLLILMSALAVALIYKVNYEQKLQSTDSGNNGAFYGAEAGMESMMAGLNSLYHFQAAPSCADVNGLTTSARPPVSDVGVTYPTYTITLSDGTPLAGCPGGTPPSRIQNITHGPNAGLQAQVVNLSMSVAALRPSGETVSMIRQVEVARLPVFQFGMFSESDLSFFPGPDFDFNGRVHTNGNLFLASSSSVTFHSPIRAVGDVVRDQLANGQGTLGQGRTGKIMIPTSGGGCDGANPAAGTWPASCRNLQMTSSINEGSSVGGPTPTNGGTGVVNTGPPNSWTTISTSASPFYGSNILSGTTGAKKLQMAFVKNGVDPIEIIRRPLNGEDPTSSLAQSRLYDQAQIRVLLSDDPAELPGGSGDPGNIRLANYKNPGPDYSTGVPVDGAAAGNGTYFAEGKPGVIAHDPVSNTDVSDPNWVSPTVGLAPNPNPLATPGADTKAPMIGATTNWNLLDGYLRVEYVPAGGGAPVAVTKEWLELGFARGNTPPTAPGGNPVHPKAILLFQQLADRNGDGNVIAVGTAGNSSSTTKTQTSATCKNPDPNGVPSGPGVCTLTSTNYTGCTSPKAKSWTYTCTSTVLPVTPELITGATGSTSAGAGTSNNWYPINMYDTREGEFRDTATGNCKVNGALNLTEIDMGNLRRWLKGTIGANGTNVDYKTQSGYILYFSDRRGMEPRPDLGYKDGEYGFEDVLNANSATGVPNGVVDAGEDVNNNKTADTFGKADLGMGFGLTPGTGMADPTKVVNCGVARANWISGARHAVRLVDAAQGNVPTRLDNNLGGFTLASENPAYILGNYNASNAGFVDLGHAESAIIADTVTLLSQNWNDLSMWANPTKPSGRPAADTWYRVAIATGKNENFDKTPYAGTPQDFGTDGGVHNFLRFLENWGGNNINYKGSMASMYYSQYATGVFKCCTTVYGAPNRNYAFDLDFQDLSKMPPGTPTVTDVENLGFQQVF